MALLVRVIQAVKLNNHGSHEHIKNFFEVVAASEDLAPVGRRCPCSLAKQAQNLCRNPKRAKKRYGVGVHPKISFPVGGDGFLGGFWGGRRGFWGVPWGKLGVFECLVGLCGAL